LLSFIIRRLLLLPITLLGLTLLIFLFMSFLSPYELLSTYISNPRQLQGNTAQILIKQYGLDQPFYIKYVKWLTQIIHGNFGWSITLSEPVATAIVERFPATLELAIYSIIPIIIIGIWLGVVAAVHHNGFIDQVLRVIALIGYSLPAFVLGLMLLFIFYGVFKLLPPGRIGLNFEMIYISSSFHHYTGLLTIDALLNGKFWMFLDALKHLVDPVLTLSFLSWAAILRITRSSMLEALDQDYVRTARAKGLSEYIVINKHARRNALIPATTIAGLMFIGILGGVVIVEDVFNYPGVGSLIAQASEQLDYATVVGLSLLFGLITVIGNLVVDVAYALIDPRVRMG